MATQVTSFTFLKNGDVFTVTLPENVVVRPGKRNDGYRLRWNRKWTLRYRDCDDEWRELMLDTVWDGDEKAPRLVDTTEVEFWR